MVPDNGKPGSVFNKAYLLKCITPERLGLTFSSTIVERILANPICCLPMRCASIRACVSPMIRKQPQTSQISFFSWKLPGSISNPATVWG